MTRSLLAFTLVLTACPEGKETGDTGEEACDVTVTTFPSVGSVDAYYRSDIEFKLNKADETATIETAIPGALEVSTDGLTVYWRLSAALAPSTAYSAILHYCSGDVELTFTTSALGTSIADPSVLVGKSYLLNLKDARVTEPAGIGSLISSELDKVDIYVGITDLEEPQITMIGALGRDEVENTQEYCEPSIDFPVADFSGTPHFEIGGDGATTITVADVEVMIDDLRIAGDFSSDLTYFGGGVLEGKIDTRPLDVALMDGEEGQICETAAGLGVICVECGTENPGVFCLILKADSITADSAPVELLVIDGKDCAGCLAGPPVDSSETCEPDPV